MGSERRWARHSTTYWGIRCTTEHESAGWYENLRVGEGNCLGSKPKRALIPCRDNGAVELLQGRFFRILKGQEVC